MATMLKSRKAQKSHFEMNLEYAEEFNKLVRKIEDEDRAVTEAECEKLMEIAKIILQDGDLEGSNLWEVRNAISEVENCMRNTAEIPSCIYLEEEDES